MVQLLGSWRHEYPDSSQDLQQLLPDGGEATSEVLQTSSKQLLKPAFDLTLHKLAGSAIGI